MNGNKTIGVEQLRHSSELAVKARKRCKNESTCIKSPDDSGMDQDLETSRKNSTTDTDLLDHLPLGLHKCDICKKEYSTSTILNRHLRNIHKEETYSGVYTKISCAVCDYKCDRYCTYCCHLGQKHGINVEYEYLIFLKEDEFIAWKTEEEKASKASFTKKRNQKSSNGWETQYFYCHRSGYINTKKQRNRALKAQGSCKINKTCPAKISVLKHLDLGSEAFIEVEYVKTHVGHSMDLTHIRLNPKDKLNIALKLMQGMSFNHLLDSVRNTLDGSVERIHLITRKDIHNIASQYKIYMAHQDVSGVELWVKEMEKNGIDNPVLLYKSQGSCHSNYPSLLRDSFVLGIMTSAQMHMLQLYGGDILLDSTSDDDGYFSLTALMVFDELRHPFPVAFLISTDLTESTLTSFFMSIKNKAGLITTHTFMTDVGSHELFYNAWLQVMGRVKKQIYSSWHIERTWKKNLSLIESKEKQMEVYRDLKTLLEEPNKASFSKMFSDTIENWLNSTTTNLFGEYFMKVFGTTVSYWAYCYLKYYALNININLEDYHKVLRHVYSEDKIMQLDTVIHTLMKYIQIKEKEQLSSLHKEEVSEKLYIIKQRHEQSIEMDFTNITLSESDEDTFYVIPTSKGTHEVRVTNSTCNCTLVCIECNICIHKYSCNCADYCFNWNICKHIHLICMKLFTEHDVKLDVIGIVQSGEDGLYTHERSLQEACKTKENEVISSELCNSSASRLACNIERQKLKELIQRLLLRIDTCNSSDEINLIKQLIAPIEPKYRW